MSLLDFDARIDEYQGLKLEILKGEPPTRAIESCEEACIEIAAATGL